jgi:SAM-dependent methyltransferase
MDLAERVAGVPQTRHPWEVSRSRLIGNLVDIAERRLGHPFRSVLDLGSGDGWLVEQLRPKLRDASRIVSWDTNYTVDDLIAELPLPVVRTVDAPQGRFDLILMLDVLEHIEDDEDFLSHVVLTHLARSGVFVITVPAYGRLFSDHDVALGHYRRYEPRQIAWLLKRHFVIEAQGGAFTSLVAARYALRLAGKDDADPSRSGLATWSRSEPVTKALTSVLDADCRLGALLGARGLRVPGLSYWAVCTRAGAR